MKSAEKSVVTELRQTVKDTGTMGWFHWSVVTLSLCLTLFAWAYSRNQLREKTALRFDRQADHVVELVVERMKMYEDALWAGVAFIEAADGDVDFESWEKFASSIQVDKRHPGINGIGVIVSLDRDETADFIRQRRRTHPSFRVHPDRVAERYWPIVSIVPLTGNEQALGLDMAHEINRITAAQQARDTGNAQVTGPIVLVQDDEKTPGFLFFAPFYRPLANSDSTSREFVGLVYAPFMFRKLMAGALEKEKRQVGIRVMDADKILFDEHLESDDDFDPNPLLDKQVTVPVYGRQWTFDIRTATSFRDSVDATKPLTILVAGFLIDGLLIGLLLMISRASRRALGVANEMTGDLEKLELATRINEIGIWDYDPVNGTVEWDDTMYKLYGRDRSDFDVGFDSWIAALHPEDRALAEAAVARSVAGSTTFDLEYRIVRPSGAVRHISSKAVVLRDDAGNATRMLGANSDITDRKTATTELESTRQIQTAILESAGVAIIATDPKGVIVMFNDAAEEMLGYHREEMLYQQTPGVFHDSEEVVQRAAELSDELGREIEPGFDVFVMKAKSGRMEQREWTYIRKDGSRLPVLLTVTALRGDDGSLSGYLGVAADISLRKQAELNIEAANATLARSNEELAQFAYVASHDLQEPLRKVTSFCQLLEEDFGEQMNDDGRQYMAFIIDGATRMRSLIQDLLAYSRIDSEQRRPQIVNVDDVVHVAVENLSEAIRESKAKIVVGDLPQVEADPVQLTQLFQNLIGNAIKYRGERIPEIQIRGKDTKTGWLFEIEDNGIGIEPKYRDQIFGIFKRLHNRSEYKGTGIGLAVCKRIVDRLSGRIWVTGSDSGGSVFCFEFSAPKANASHQPLISRSSGENATIAEAAHGSSINHV